ncbi:MAG TPA: 3-dehydroquinate synthase [Candidatus Baltobacteraceae bacterium]|jgi:3-dehydroquinate synthase|nr:3-dehydroquinate synthase [Candidatus Baltobacteraceae bacterium]
MIRLDDLPYPIIIDFDSQVHLVEIVKARGARAVVLCDRNVETRAQRLARAIGAPLATFALGERRKRLRIVEEVLDTMIELGADRETIVVGVGGGVAGDVFGFAAGIYMRGVRFVNVATSLVAMVDAAIGGKTGVDLRGGKNLAGVFRDPIAVLCDIGALKTLPDRQLREGMAEVVKHGIIEGGEVFAHLEELAAHELRRWPWEVVVAEQIKVKVMVVAEDRLEAGRREVLNLGHTFAHAIERASSYRISHGEAVAVGLRAAGLLALRCDRFSREEHLRVLSLLALLDLPLSLSSTCGPEIVPAMTTDKKTRNGHLRFVLPRKIGDVEFGVRVPLPSVRAVVKSLWNEPGSRELR